MKTERPWQVWLTRPHWPPRVVSTWSTAERAVGAMKTAQASRDRHSRVYPQDAGKYSVKRRG